MKKTLQVAGALALIAWTAFGAFAWYKTRAGVHLTLREGEAEEALPLHLIEERVGTLAAEIDELVASLRQGFDQLARTLEERDSTMARETALLGERLQALEAAVSRNAAMSVAATPAEDVPAAQLVPEPPVDPVTPEEARTGDGAAPGQPAKKSFLAFELPSRDFRFDGLQTFEILGDLSRVGFDAKSTLHDFTGASSKVRGRFSVDLAHPEQGMEGRVEIQSSSVDTGLDARDETMHEHLASDEFEWITFEPSAFAPDDVDAAHQTLKGRIRGRMTIRGVTRELELAVEAHVDEGRRLVIEGETPLSLPDYEVPVPSQLGLISMDKEVRVWVHLRARARAAEGR